MGSGHSPDPRVTQMMRVHILADNTATLSAVSTMLKQKCVVTSELLCSAGIRNPDIDAIVVAADIRVVENISALKAASAKLTRIPKRIFLIDRRGRLSVVQAYALGATQVLPDSVNSGTIAGAKLFDGDAAAIAPDQTVSGGLEAASAGAASIASMFAAVASGAPIDIRECKKCREPDRRQHFRKRPVRLADDGSPSSRRHLSALSAGNGNSRRFRIEPRHGDARHRAVIFGRDVSRHRQGENSPRRSGQTRTPRRLGSAH